MIVDGKKISADIKARLSAREGSKPKMAVVMVGEDPASVAFVNVKKRFGENIGVEVKVYNYEETITQTELEQIISNLADKEEITGIVLQLPVPKHLNADQAINLITPNKDVDALGAESRVLSPVVAAVKEILEINKIDLTGKRALVIGKGKLVGKPVSVWLAGEGANVQITDSQTNNLNELLQTADIIVTGAGNPHFIKPEMIKEGVVLIDAATSEAAGKLAGDADPACADKSAVFTPVPGGVGPITVAKLFENLFFLKG